jgi:hypothetical protein
MKLKKWKVAPSLQSPIYVLTQKTKELKYPYGLIH